MEGSLGKGGVISKFGVKSILVKLQTLAAMGIRAEMQFLACCVSLGISVLRMRVLTELRTLHFVQSRDFRRAGSAAAADFSCVRFESPVAFPWFVTSNLCDSINLLLFQSSRSRCLECTRPAHPSRRITDRRIADCHPASRAAGR